MRYFQVKFGFGDNDFVRINENELKKAIIAQTTGKIGVFDEGTITGDKIIAITPDVNRMMGWNRNYKPTSEDFGEIPEKLLNDHISFLREIRAEITGASVNSKKISEPVKQLTDKFKGEL